MNVVFGRTSRIILLFVIPIVLASCATYPNLQPQVNGFVYLNNYQQAASILQNNPDAYGKRNRLLYLLEAGYVSHLAGQYSQSVEFFQKAKNTFDQLFTKSISAQGLSWLINDNTAPYYGEDFERVMINIFQSLNYAMLGNFEDALVEARDLNSVLSLINLSYPGGKKDVYRDDAFARLLMGIFYESSRTKEGYNDAFIAYSKAVEIYERCNKDKAIPEVLKENILTTAEFMGPPEFQKFRSKFNQTKFVTLKEKADKAELYIIQYNGFSPIKVEDILPLPFKDGYIVQFAFPRYQERIYYTVKSEVSALNEKNECFKSATEPAEDISAIAIDSLKRRKLRVMAKAVASSAGKYFLERAAEKKLREKVIDKDEAIWFRIASSIFNVVSSRADLRSWQTLPAQIRITRLLLEPGEYVFSITDFNEQNLEENQADLGKVRLGRGQKRFIITRSVR